MEFTKHVSDTGFPYCPICGSALAWSGNYMASEAGYLPEDASVSEDVIIDNLCCRECGHDFETTQDEEGHYRLISAAKFYEEDETDGEEHEPEIFYGDYAKQIFDNLD